jgi:tetratricopeptide (TPR) repeat protein
MHHASRHRAGASPGPRAALARTLALSLVLVTCLATAARAQAAPPPDVPLYDNLGSHHYAIGTAVPLAQRYFDQGLRLYYAFNHDESIRAFREAARLDARCAICWWGVALAYGPNINVPMDAEAGEAAYEALTRARSLAHHATPVEQALIEALATRYAETPSPERAALDSAYARAMAGVAERYPDDLEAATLYAESLMTLSPWEYWTGEGEARPDTPALLAQLERVMESSADHPGANHFYIHAVEAVDPYRAVAAAERLAGLMPGAGHLVHMPGHIYIRVGRYEDAIRANEHAVHADETFIRDHSPGMGVYTLGYYPHNYDFLAFAASMIGRSGQAMGAAEKVAELVPAEMMAAPGMTFLQHYAMRHLQMKVRFGRWDDILAVPAPDAELAHASGLWHYARGRALAARGDVAAAETHLERVRAMADRTARDGLVLEFNPAAAILNIAADVLAGHVAAAAGDHDHAVQHLQAAAQQEDQLVYGEPPEWSIPVRQELGAILLAAGRHAAAETAFRQDLDRFPDNGWSLHGLALALRAQGRDADADAAMQRFTTSWASADIQLPGR